MNIITLKQWFFRNTRFPLITLGSVVALVQIAFLIHTHKELRKGQDKAIRNLVATVANIGIQQKNRTLLESSFQLAIEELGVKSMIVCKGSRRLFHQPAGFGSCPNPPQSNSYQYIIEINPSGFHEYKFYFYVSRFPLNFSLVALNGITLIFLIIVFRIIYKIQRKFHDDILFPLKDALKDDLSEKNKFQINELNSIRETFDEHRKSKEKQAIAGAIVEHNMNINHNIKSIKQTLDVIISGEFSSNRQKKRFHQVSNDFTRLMAKVAEQIPDRNQAQLITSDKTFFEYLEEGNQKKTKVNVKDAFEIAIEHKKIETKAHAEDIHIDLSYKDEIKNLFIEAVDPELRGILSNLMNNSIDSKATHIQIELCKKDSNLVATLVDNGAEIPEDIKKNIFHRGFSWGKEKGTGYGLYHAQKFIESWGGELNLLKSKTRSKDGSKKGQTIFEIRLPLWKPSPINLDSKSHIVIVDDEESVHSKWSEKITSINPSAKVLHFKKPHEFQVWFSGNHVFSDHVFFFDSDLGDNEETGEHLIDEMGLNHMSYLVTNNYNNSKLASWCNKRSIQVIPKGYLLG